MGRPASSLSTSTRRSVCVTPIGMRQFVARHAESLFQQCPGRVRAVLRGTELDGGPALPMRRMASIGVPPGGIRWYSLQIGPSRVLE